jgi:hypothetical protein
MIILFPLFAYAASPTSQRRKRSDGNRGLGQETFVLDYQSGDNNFADWITLLTLCLAPVIAHLVAGVPEPGKSTCNMSRLSDAFLYMLIDLSSVPLPQPTSLD